MDVSIEPDGCSGIEDTRDSGELNCNGLLVGTLFVVEDQEELDDIEEDLDRGASEKTEEVGEIVGGVEDWLRQDG